MDDVAAQLFGRRRAGRRASPRRLGALGVSILGLAAFAAPAQATPGIGVHAPVETVAANPALGGWPAWYQDADGMQLQLCIEDPSCLAQAEYDTTQPLSFPDNFPVEAFWWAGETTLTMPSGGSVLLVLAQEAVWINEEVSDGDQGGFGRVRIRGGAGTFTPNGWYRITHPFGQVEIQAGATGVINTTDDTGCLVAPCGDAGFDSLAASQIGPTFLQWDTAESSPAPGFIGDGATPHRVVGSSFVAPGETTPANYFRIEHISGPGGGVLSTSQTDLFAVQGWLVDNTDPSGVLVGSDGRFAGQRVRTASAPKTITLRNGGSGTVDLDALAIGGPAAGQFALGAGCAGGDITLAAGESCTAPVTFTPDGTGPREAQIEATENVGGVAKTRTIKLTGTGIVPVLAVSGPVAFGSQLVGSVVGPRTVTVRNTGTDTMHVDSVTLGGAQPGDYTFGLDTCSGQNVAPGAGCTTDVHFTPKAAGARDAALNVGTDAGTRPVALSGIGVATAAQVTPSGATGAPGAVVGNAVGAPNTAQSTTATKLKLTSLGGPLRIKRSKATKTGIRLVMRLQGGTKVVQIKIYRRTTRGRRLLSAGFKTPASTTGRYRVKQSHPALRRSFRTLGTYEVEVTPGTSRTALGTASRRSFKIVR